MVKNPKQQEQNIFLHFRKPKQTKFDFSLYIIFLPVLNYLEELIKEIQNPLLFQFQERKTSKRDF